MKGQSGTSEITNLLEANCMAVDNFSGTSDKYRSFFINLYSSHFSPSLFAMYKTSSIIHHNSKYIIYY